MYHVQADFEPVVDGSIGGRSLYERRAAHVQVNAEEDNDTLGPPMGLYNLGNTCYMNAALQCLVHCRPFVAYFNDVERQACEPPGGNDTRAYRAFSELCRARGPLPAYAPRAILQVCSAAAHLRCDT
jgi:ubiquitin C-terminal hydrolase